jgi:V/A-type H+-transporting ATPase subunit F
VRIVAIGHPDAVLGFSLAAVDGVVATSAEQVNRALDDVLSTQDVGIVLVTDDVASLIEGRMDQLRLQSTIPLVVEVPGPRGEHADRPTLSDIIRRAIGVDIPA